MAAWNPEANEIFLKAVEIRPLDERRTYLDEACRGDAQLRGQVEALIAAGEQAGSFLESPPPGVTAAADSSPLSEQPGTTIGPYKLLEQIGEGGMGVVFMAEQHEPVRRKVALKLIKPGMDTRQFIARFEAERQALAVMDHPSIARVLDAGATPSGHPYFVMELVRGVPITTYCDENHLPVRERLELFATVCQAIQHAHTKGIIHRDIKPNNVLVTRQDGRPVVKVIDFGVAKAIGHQLTEKTLFTNFAQMIGTPLYMSPEQAEQSGVDIDTRSDIFSLGVLLYELLTGSTPVNEEQMKKAAFDEIRRIIREDQPQVPSLRISSSNTLPAIAAHRHIEAARLSRLVRGELDWIVMKALEKDRGRRYETANGFAADVLHYLHDEPVLACPASSAYRLKRFARRNKRLLTTVTALGTLLVAATIGAVLAAVQSGRLAEKEQELRSVAEQRADAEAKARRELDKRLYVNRIALAQQELYAQNTGRAQELLDECPLPLRGWEWHFLKRFRPGNPLMLPGDRRGAAFSPDGQSLALTNVTAAEIIDPSSGSTIRTLGVLSTWVDFYGVAFNPKAGETVLAVGDSDGKVVKIWNTDTGQEIRTLDGHGLRLRTIAFSPDGQRLAAGSISHGLKVWDWRTGELVFEQSGLFVARVAFSPDGRSLAVALFDNDKDVIIYDAATGRKIRSFGKHSGGPECVVYSPNGRHLATCGDDGIVKIWHAATGELLQSMRGHSGPIKDVVHTPDGQRLVSAGWDKTIKIWDVETGQETLTLRGHTDIVMKLEFSPDGHLLVSTGMDGAKVWNATPVDEMTGSEGLNVPGHTDSVKSVAFSPDGRLMASAGSDRLIKVWDVATLGRGIKPESLTLQGDTDTDMSVAFSPDSRRLSSAGWGGSLKVWDTLSAQLLLKLPLYTEEAGDDIRSIAFSPDGRRLASLGPGALAMRDATTGEKLMVISIPAGNLNTLACSPDGRYVAASRHFSVVIWDLETRKEVRWLGHSGMVRSVAYSPDGKRLASASFDHTIKIWDTTSWNEIRSLRGHTDRVMSVAFSPDGKRLASGSADSTVKVWDATGGQELATFRGHIGYVWSVAFSADGTRLTSAGGHHNKGEVKVWDLATTLDAPGQGEQVEKARRQATEFYEMLATAQPKVWEHRRNLGHAHVRQDQWEKAAVEYAKAVELNPAAWQEVIESLKASGQLAEPDKAEGIRQRIIEMLESRLAEQPKDRQARQQLAWTLGEAANISQSPADRDLREQLLRRALALHTELANEPPGDAGHLEQTGHLFRYLGWFERDKGRLDEARQNFEKAVDVFKKLAPDDPPQRNGFYRDFEADTHLQLASVLAAGGKSEAADKAAQQAADMYETLDSQFPDHSDYPKKAADAQRVLADRLEAAGRHEECEKIFRRLITHYEKLAADSPDNREYQARLSQSYFALIDMLLPQGKHAEAEETIRQAIGAFEKLAAAHPAVPNYHRSRADFQRRMAQQQAADKRTTEAEKSYLDAINLYERIIAEFPQYEDLWRVYDGLALALAATNRFDEADEANRKAVELAPNNAGTLNSLAWSFATSKDVQSRNASLAVELAKRGIELEPNNVQLSNTLGVAYYRAGNWQDAVEWLEKSMKLGNGGDSFDWFFLAMAHWQLDNKDEARKWQARAVEWMDANKPNDPQLLRFRTESEELMKDATTDPDQGSAAKAEGNTSP